MASKSINQRNFYKNAIRKVPYEPTAPSAKIFDNSNDSEEEYSVQESAGRRPLTKKQKIADFWHDHFIKIIGGGAFTLISGVLIWYVTSNVSEVNKTLGGHTSTIESLKGDIGRVEKQVSELTNKVQSDEKDLAVLKYKNGIR